MGEDGFFVDGTGEKYLIHHVLAGKDQRQDDEEGPDHEKIDEGERLGRGGLGEGGSGDLAADQEGVPEGAAQDKVDERNRVDHRDHHKGQLGPAQQIAAAKKKGETREGPIDEGAGGFQAEAEGGGLGQKSPSGKEEHGEGQFHHAGGQQEAVEL